MVTENRVRGGLFGTSLRRARVYNSRRSVCFALPLRTLALCTFQAARRGRRGEGASVSPVRASRGFEFSTRFSRGSAAAGSRRSILSMELRF